jgi:hypothetical protein
MDLRDSPDVGGSVRRARGEVSSMAVPALAVAVVLTEADPIRQIEAGAMSKLRQPGFNIPTRDRLSN